MLERRQALRLERKRQLLGTATASCVECGINDVRVLQRNGKRKTVLCHSCFRKRSGVTVSSVDQRRSTLAVAGYTNAECASCGEATIETLELHHIAAEANSSEVVPLCLNCHAVASDAQEDTVVDFRLREDDRSPLLTQAAYQIGVAIFLGLLVLFASRISETQRTSFANIAASLWTWASWNVMAHAHFTEMLGSKYASTLKGSS